MKYLLIASVVAAQLVTSPGLAASLSDPVATSQARTGAFAGARVRIAFGGRESGKARAGLAIAQMRETRSGDGRVATSIGNGLEFGARPDAPLGFSVADYSIGADRLGADDGRDDRKRKRGVPTWALVLGGVVLATGIGFAIFIDALNDASE